jgi:multidrug efflux system outer membrane protein
MLLLASCTLIGPDYVPENLNAPNNFSSATIRNDFTNDEINTAWWKSFNDPQLVELVERASVENRTVKQALERVNEARAVKRELILDLLPTATANGGYTKQKNGIGIGFVPTGPNSGFAPFDYYHAGFDATWEIDYLGGGRRAVEAQSAEEQSSMASLGDAIRSVIGETASNYFQLRGSQEQYRVAEANTKVQGETLRLIELRYKNGQSSELDVARARSQYEATASTLPLVEADIRVAIHRIGILTGQPPETYLPVLLPPQPIPLYDGPIAVGSPDTLLRRRPDVRAAERTAAAETARVGVEMTDLYPRITFNGTLAYQAKVPSGLFDKKNETYFWGPSITWAGLDIPKVLTRIDAQDARARSAVAGYQQAVLTALEDVENALARFSTERDRRGSLKRSSEASERAVELAQFQFKEGQTDLFTVLDAQRVQLLAEGSLALSDTQLAINLISVYKALGGGWESVAVAPKNT